MTRVSRGRQDHHVIVCGAGAGHKSSAGREDRSPVESDPRGRSTTRRRATWGRRQGPARTAPAARGPFQRAIMRPCPKAPEADDEALQHGDRFHQDHDEPASWKLLACGAQPLGCSPHLAP